VLDPVDHRREFPAQPFVQPDAEDLTDAVGRRPPQADLAAARLVLLCYKRLTPWGLWFRASNLKV
jgi:hypothetical protein